MAHQTIDFGTAAPNDGELISTAFVKIDENFEELYHHIVGVIPSGLVEDDSSASAKATNKAAIEAAAVEALTEQGVKVICIPSGTYWCDSEIEIGVGGADQKSLHLRGSGGGAVENETTILRFSGVTTAAVIIGNGQFMQVSDIAVVGDTAPTSRAALTGVGIGLNHNTHQILLANVRVVGFHTGIKTGYDGDVLCDSLTLHKSSVAGCYIGLHVSQSQNYINSLYDCVFSDCTIAIKSDVAKAVNVWGGNYSTSDGEKAGFAISGVSSLTPFTDTSDTELGSFANATFTAVITSPDDAMTDGAYDAFAIDTTAFGPIPLRLTAYNSGTATATFKFLPQWLLGTGFEATTINGGDLETLLETALSGASLLYACEQVTTFQGYCFNVDGAHVENPDTLTRFFHCTSGLGGDTASRFNRITFNHSLAHGNLFSGTNAQKAVAYCQQVFPFIDGMRADDIRCELSHIVNVAADDRVMIDWKHNRGRFIVRDCDLRPNLRVALKAISAINNEGYASTAYGFGEWDETPFEGTADTQHWYGRNRSMGLPFTGYFPAPHAKLTIDVTTYDDIADGLGAVGSYPALMGRVPYEVNYPTPIIAVSGASPARWIESDHTFWSYGQNLSIDWSYVGGSNIIRLSATSRMFAGLRFIIDNGGGDESYVVTGVYPSLGFITVVRWRAGTGSTHTAGTYGTTYNGSTVKQEAFSFSRVGFTKSYTVANLPSAATVGANARAFATDANATTFASTVAGGGANFVPVYSDGTNWKIG